MNNIGFGQISCLMRLSIISTAGVKVNFTCKVYRLAPVDKTGSLKKIFQGRNTFRVTYMGLLKIVQDLQESTQTFKRHSTDKIISFSILRKVEAS